MSYKLRLKIGNMIEILAQSLELQMHLMFQLFILLANVIGTEEAQWLLIDI
jgi:hypothetical protein